MNRTDRLVAMVMFLQGRRLVRAEEMAVHFEISVRTVYRDIAALSEAGVPISGEAGVGYSLMKSYHLPPVMLTAEEASALFFGAELAKQYTDGSLLAPLEAALLKLRAVLPRDRQDYLEQLSKKTVVFGPPAHRRTPRADRQWLMPLQEAAVRRRVVKIAYRARAEEETVREVEPLGVVFYGGGWYLVAWCRLRGDLRHFRLDRIQNVDTKEEVFGPRPEFSLASHFALPGPCDEQVTVRLYFEEAALERVRRESWTAPVEEKPRDGGMKIVMKTYSLEWMAAWLLSFGPDVEVIEPDLLRERIRILAEGALQRSVFGRERESQLV